MDNNDVLFEPRPWFEQMALGLVLVLVMPAIALFFVYKALSSPFTDMGFAIFILLVSSTALVVLVSISLGSVRYKIYKDHIEGYKMGQLKENVLLRDIDSWDEEVSVNRGVTTKALYIFRDEQRYNLGTNRMYNDYDALKNFVTQSKKRNTTDWKQSQRPLLIAGMVLGLVLLAAGVISMQHKQPTITAQQLQTVSAPLWQAVNHNLGKNGHLLTINLQSYRDFTFIVDPTATNQSLVRMFLNASQAGDIVDIDIPIIDYDKKITQQQPLNLWDRIYRYHYISAYGLRLHRYPYASVEAWNDAGGNNNANFIFFIVGGLMLLLGCGAALASTRKRAVQ